MDICGKIVRTPYDETYPDYDPNWRSLVAKFWAESAGRWLPPPFINDDIYIRQFVEYLQYEANVNTSGPIDFWRTPARYQPYRMAQSWHSSAEPRDLVKYKIEPLLLTGAPLEVIAKDVGGKHIPPQVLRTYEKLYFNVRDENDDLVQSCHVCMRFAFDGHLEMGDRVPMSTFWKVHAYQLGYVGIHTAWHTPHPAGTYKDDKLFNNELMRMIKSTMVNRLVRGDVNNFDLNAMLGQYVNYENMVINRGIAGVDKEDPARTQLVKVLRAFAPQVLEAAMTVDQKKEQTGQLKQRFEANSAVLRQQGYDAGKDVGDKAVNDLLTQRLAVEVEAMK